ncbi:hypothetical protein [Azospirillum endophyticum]
MVVTLVHALALATTSAGAVSLYLAAPCQQWLPRPLSAWPGRVAGTLALSAGWMLWSVVLHPVTAIFTSLIVSMALFTALPFAAVARASALAWKI